MGRTEFLGSVLHYTKRAGWYVVLEIWHDKPCRLRVYSSLVGIMPFCCRRRRIIILIITVDILSRYYST